jgi:glycosyltransferase involved in cell wall biosynthesis
MAVVLFDATRLAFRGWRGAPTGIDRVALAYGRWLLAHPDVELVPVWCHEGRLRRMDRRLFEQSLAPRRHSERNDEGIWPELLSALARADDEVTALRAKPRRESGATAFGWYAQALARTLASAPRMRPPPADFYVNVNHYGIGQAGLLARLRAQGVKPVVMIHDLIPIAFPEFCSPLGRTRHEQRMDAVLEHAALVIGNSASTAAEVAAFAAERGVAPPPLCVAPLGIETTFLTPRSKALSDRPYFICVGTIEPRKNLTFLLTVWRRLAERMGEATPRLVLVGRRGWECESVVDQLERSPPIQRYVHEVSDLHDEQLADLISGATALLAPSFIEGFDLPSIEALALGTPVIASDIPAHRELARDAQVIDPLDGLGWADAIEAAATARRPRIPHAPPTWTRHFEIVGEAMGLAPARLETATAAA